MLQKEITQSSSIKVNDDFDVIILGTGIAGLFTALNIHRQYRVLLVSKTSITQNNSSLAQGGIATSQDEKIHYEDTLRAGVYHNNIEAVKLLTKASLQAIKKLIEYGVTFDQDKNGRLLYTREGGHSQQNILHVKDETGKHIIEILAKEVKKRSNIQLKENLFIKDIITNQQKAKGVIAINETDKLEVYFAKATVIATGGIGQLYQHTTNQEGNTGDGIAMAYRAGAMLKDMEFIQFHPTAFYEEGNQQRFLISEAVRGEGGILRNKHKEAFMIRYHPLKELAPRDIVARAILQEMIDTDHPCVYLDITHKSSQYIQDRFPMIYSKCLSLGVDITKDWIPVAPAEHYIMGGIEVDLDGRTKIKNLYACGECAATGLHGANRLASNSLLEGVVFGNRLAKTLNSSLIEEALADTYHDPIDLDKIIKTKYHSINSSSNQFNDFQLEKPYQLVYLKEELKKTMGKHLAVIRNKREMGEAYIIINDIIAKLNNNPQNTIPYYEILNMATVAKQIVIAAYSRTESIGAHHIISNNSHKVSYKQLIG